MTQAFYRKWRPQLWDEVVGQEHIIQTLMNAVVADRVAHAYLFAGPRGTGKTTTARLLAKAVNCENTEPSKRPDNTCSFCQAVNEGRFMDLIEIDAASNTSVEDVRDLRDKINFAPSQGKYKVYIIDEVHMLSTAAFNALLKTLEEPPPHAIFILATTEIHKIPATVLSRCQRHEFRRISVAEITARLKKMAVQENLSIDADALTLLARQATGSLRDAESLLDQLASSGKKIDIALAQTMLGTATNQAVVELVDAILNKEPAAGLNLIHRSLDAGSDPRQFARQAVDYLRSLLLVKMGSADQVEATSEQRAQMAQHAQAFSLPILLETLRTFNSATSDLRSSWHPGLALELAFAEVMAPPAPAAAVPPAGPAPAAEPPATKSQRSPAASSAPARPEPPSQAAPAQPAAKTQPVEPTEKSNSLYQLSTAAPASEPAKAKTTSEALESSPPPASQPAKAISLQMVLQNWKKVRDIVRKQRSQVDGLLNSCHPLGIKDGEILLLGFATEVLKSKMEMGDNLVLTRQALRQVLGVDLRVICVIASGKAGGLPPGMEVDNDGMVSTVLRDLGGEIVDIH